jgi:hypothetical protein
VAGDEAAVFCEHEVGFDEVGALLDAELIGGERVLWAVTAGSAVGDDDGGGGERHQGYQGNREQAGRVHAGELNRRALRAR